MHNISFLIVLLLCGLSVLPSSALYAQSAFDDPATRSADPSKAGDLVSVEKKIDAGAVALGASSQIVVLLQNESVKPIQTGKISLYPSSNVSASISSDECEKQALLPNVICAVALNVQGLQPGTFSVQMLIQHDGISKLTRASVSGVVDNAADNTREVSRDLEVVPGDLDFGSLKDSRPLTRSVIFRNVTSKVITIESIDIEANDQSGYSYKSDCVELQSGAACVTTVNWAPQQNGPSTGVLTVKHDGPTGIVTVLLDGTYSPTEASQVGIFPEAVPGKGLLTASNTEIDFGTDIETASSITTSLVNIGDTELTLGEIRLANENTGVSILRTGCLPGLVLDPVEACPLTLKWEPVRQGSILDDVQILHDGARGILVLPVRGEASGFVNKDSQTFDLSDGGFLSTVPKLEVSDVSPKVETSYDDNSVSERPVSKQRRSSVDVSGSLEGYKITSMARNRAVITGPGGSRVIFNKQETVIGGVLWQVEILSSAIEFVTGDQKMVLLFDQSLTGQGGSLSTSASNESSSAVTSSTETTSN